MQDINDNELLYLLSENDEFAFEILMEKYEPMIINRLKRYHVKPEFWDDYYQECIILLYRCATGYREDVMKTFNRYYDRMLQFQIRNMLRKDKKSFYRVVLMSSDEIDGLTTYKVEEKSPLKPMNINGTILDERFVRMLYDGSTIKEIAQTNNITYYQAYHIVKKVRENKVFKENINSTLSAFENNVYELYRNGYKPKNIAELLSIEPRKVYGALKRIRTKEKNRTSICEI